jgi:hypothetical protein
VFFERTTTLTNPGNGEEQQCPTVRPIFKKVNRVLSGAWGVAIFAIGVCRVAAAAVDRHESSRLPELLLGLAAPLVIIGSMLRFSKSYPDRVTHKPAEGGAGPGGG